MKARGAAKAHRHPQEPDTGGNGASLTDEEGRGSTPQSLRELTDRILADEEHLRQGGGLAGHQRQKRLGRLPVRHRLELLLDRDTPWLELNLWAAWGMYPEAGEIAAAGVVTGIGQVQGRSCMVVANDATVKAGAFFPATVKKVLRAQRIAARCNLPLLYLVDSAGLAATAARPPDHVYDLVGLHGAGRYDARELLECIVDEGSMLEYKAEYGQSIVCSYTAIGGQKVGIVANQHIVTHTGQGEAQLGGVIYPEAADKAARFVMDCTQTGLPLLFVQDVMGFMVGPEAEGQGIIRRGAKLVSAVSNSASPKITLIVGGSFGAGNYALCGKAFDPTFVFAWPSARYAVMGADQAAGTILEVRRRQDQRDGRTPAEDELRELYEQIRARYERQTDIRYGAARGWVDAIIAPDTTRDVLSQALRLATRPPPPGGFRAGVFQV